jgi:hypothetical protein
LPAAGEPALSVHFEVIADHLPAPLKDMIARFPPGVLQFEVGVQSFSVPVQQLISRRQDNARTEDNLRWLVEVSNAHLHADLIFGLPGEDLASFGAGFDRLLALGPHEIQLGVLKRLRGTPITRLGAEHGMVYDPSPPYTVRQTACVSAADMQRFVRLARYWDLLANSGRFQRSMPSPKPSPPRPWAGSTRRRGPSRRPSTSPAPICATRTTSTARAGLRARRQPGLRPGRGGDHAAGTGCRSLLFASGMAAATAVFQALAPGDHVLAPKVMYWSLRNWLMNFATQWGLQVELIDMTDPPRCRPRSARARPSWCGSRRRPTRCGR